MASTLLKFGHAKEEDVCAVALLLHCFLEQVAHEKDWKIGNNYFGPIHCSGCMRDPRDGKYSIAIQIWSEHADTLFTAIDKFFSDWSIFVEYERKDTK